MGVTFYFPNVGRLFPQVCQITSHAHIHNLPLKLARLRKKRRLGQGALEGL